jgi:hypothetical protein
VQLTALQGGQECPHCGQEWPPCTEQQRSTVCTAIDAFSSGLGLEDLGMEHLGVMLVQRLFTSVLCHVSTGRSAESEHARHLQCAGFERGKRNKL